MLGEKIAHGTPFRRAMEEGCLDGHRVVQIGLRGSNYSLDDYDWGRKQVIILKILIMPPTLKKSGEHIAFDLSVLPTATLFLYLKYLGNNAC